MERGVRREQKPVKNVRVVGAGRSVLSPHCRSQEAGLPIPLGKAAE